MTPTPHLKAAEPSFSIKRTSPKGSRGGRCAPPHGGPHLSRTFLPTHTLARTSPPPPAALRSNPRGLEKARRGGRAAWNLAIFDRNELGAAKGRGLSLTLACCLSPGLVLSLQGLPPHVSRMHAVPPCPIPLRSLVFTPQPLHCLWSCRLSPLPGEQALLRIALSSPLPKTASRQGPAGAVAGAGSLRPFRAQPRSRIAT